MYQQGIYTLNQLADEGQFKIWHQGWLSAEQLGLEEMHVDIWSSLSLS